MRGAAIKAVQELLGHSTIEITMRYWHPVPTSARTPFRCSIAPRLGHKEGTKSKMKRN